MKIGVSQVNYFFCFLLKSSEILPFEAIECYSPWCFPESPASAAAMKAFPLGLDCPWNGSCLAHPLVVSLAAEYLIPGNLLRAYNAPPREG